MHMEEDLGFSPGLIGRWSKTKTSPSFDKIVDIVRYLNISFEDLLRDEEDEEDSFCEEEETEGEHYRQSEGFSSYNSFNKKKNDSRKETFYKKLAELTEQRKIYWEKGRDGGCSFDFPIENVVDIRKYSTHEWYYYKTRTGYFVLVVQYEQHVHILHTALYVVADSLLDPVKEETVNSKWYEKILKYADEKFYDQILKDRADDIIDDFLNMDFSKVSGMK